MDVTAGGSESSSAESLDGVTNILLRLNRTFFFPPELLLPPGLSRPSPPGSALPSSISTLDNYNIKDEENIARITKLIDAL